MVPACRLDKSFGYLTPSEGSGWCAQGSCHVFAVVIGEFNYNSNDANDVQCFKR